MKNKQNIMKIIKSTGRIFYGSEELAKNAPQDTGKLEFFKLDIYISNNDLEKEYKNRGLIPASIISLCKYDKTNREELDRMESVGTFWKDADGKWCFATFHRWRDGRDMGVNRHDDGWDDDWWFAGFRKLGTKTSDPKSLPSDTLNFEKRIAELESKMEKLTKIINL